MNRVLQLVSIAAMLLSIGATPKPTPADRNMVVVHNKSDVAIEYTVEKSGGPEKGCLLPGGTFTRIYFVSLTAVAFEFFYGHKVCAGFGNRHKETHAFHQPKTIFQAEGLDGRGYHVTAYE